MGSRQVENWDDDGELEGGPIFTTTSLSAVKTSVSSRRSTHSESNFAEDDWTVPLASQDDQSTSNAIASAKQAGIPIPQNVPASALVGGTIKRLKPRKSRPRMNDDWAEDLELPQGTSEPLKLRPSPFADDTTPDADFDDWAEGSLGIRTAGHGGSKNRGSSASAMSPSMGSCMTFESEEDGLDGLVIPTGPVDFDAALKKRKISDAQDQTHVEQPQQAPQTPIEQTDQNQDDFFNDIEFDNGDIFDTKKRTMNRNVKPNWKPSEKPTPQVKTHTNLTFSERMNSTRLPRPIAQTRTNRLEPVFEARAMAHHGYLRPEPTTTNAQLLRQKRSMPVLSSQQSRHPHKQPSVPSFPTSTFQHGAPTLRHRPPILQQRRDSDPNRSASPTPRSSSRLSSGNSPETPTRPRRDVAPTSLAREAASKRTVTRPAKRRNFGDGTELDLFDDLPTSAAKENKFTKTPSSRQPPKLRGQTSLSRLGNRDQMTTPLPQAAPRSPTKQSNLPRFAQDTAASRIAREQKLQAVPNEKRSSGPLSTKTNWAAQIASRTPTASPSARRGLRKVPQLINPMGKENIRQFQDDAAKKGMQWNPNTSCWEGNENALAFFDNNAPQGSPPRPALITNLAGAAQGVQVVGGMVFDPQKMCWLKIGASRPTAVSPSVEEEDDPFAGIPDLQDTRQSTGGVGGGRISSGAESNEPAGEWLVGEEFDLGPEFIRRQREEETLWRAKAKGWFSETDTGEGQIFAIDGWAIKDIALKEISFSSGV